MFGRLKPVNGYYRVHAQLLAGEYPGGWDERSLKAGLRCLLDVGVTFFLDLTEEQEKGLPPYAPALRAEAQAAGRLVEHRRMPIPDFETPTAAQMRDILDMLDAALVNGHTVYVHCYAGLGRTGTVVGCYLVRHGRSGQEALDQLARLRRGTALDDTLSPVTDEQRRLVYEWAAFDAPHHRQRAAGVPAARDEGLPDRTMLPVDKIGDGTSSTSTPGAKRRLRREKSPHAETRPHVEESPPVETPSRAEERPPVETPPRAEERPPVETSPCVETSPRVEERPHAETLSRAEEHPREETPSRAMTRPLAGERPRTETPSRAITRPLAGKRPHAETRPLVEEHPHAETPSRAMTRPLAEERPRAETPLHVEEPSSAEERPGAETSLHTEEPSRAETPLHTEERPGPGIVPHVDTPKRALIRLYIPGRVLKILMSVLAIAVVVAFLGLTLGVSMGQISLPVLKREDATVDLEGDNLQGAHLWGADLQGSDLAGANLRGANAQRAELRSAILVEADLRYALLNEADLREADLRGANLQWADLMSADLSGAQLEGASLENARLENATLPDGSRWTFRDNMRRFTDPTYHDFWRP